MAANIRTELIERAAAGDEAAFESIYRRLKDPLYGFVFRMVGDRGAAEDITQETFIFYIRSPYKFDPLRGSLDSFLCGVARNKVLHYFRSRGSSYENADEMPEVRDVTPGPLEILLNKELSARIMFAVGELSPILREAILLREMQGFSYQEIAEITSSDIGAVKLRIHRARKHLAEALCPAKEISYELQRV